MATTSTNKQPLLTDRPLLAIKTLSGTSTPAGSSDPGGGTAAEMLVDCTSNDGALIESITLVQRVAGDASFVNLYLSTSAVVLGSDGWFLDRLNIAAAGDPGTTAEFPLLPILAPVPHANGTTGTAPRFFGLRLPTGMALWAAVDSATPVANAPNIVVQGGFY